MNKEVLEKYLKLLGSDNNSDAVRGLRGIQSLFQSAGASLDNSLRTAADNLDRCVQDAGKTVDSRSERQSIARADVKISGVPQCRVPRAGSVEIVLSGRTEGDIYQLPGESARHAEIIADHLKDTVVAAILNKSRFKLKLLDIKNGRGEVVETALQAEYEHPDMVPVRIWVNSRGEAGALATVLRKAVAKSLPEMAA